VSLKIVPLLQAFTSAIFRICRSVPLLHAEFLVPQISDIACMLLVLLDARPSLLARRNMTELPNLKAGS